MRRFNISGFTVIELLIVLSLILLASSYVVVTSGTNYSLALNSSQRLLTSICHGARGQSILNQTPVRVIIYADKGLTRDDDKYLRFMGIIKQDENDPQKWHSASKGSYLSKGIYFMPDYSEKINGIETIKPTNMMKIHYPRLSSQYEGDGEDYYYYEFNQDGTINNAFLNKWLVVGAGTLRPDNEGKLEVFFDDQNKEGLKSGIIFRRVGSTSLVTDSDQIELVYEKQEKSRLK